MYRAAKRGPCGKDNIPVEGVMKELIFRSVDLSRIINRNEDRVIKAMEMILGEVDWQPEPLDIQDIYALSLNRLPPRYVQEGTIVFNEPIRNRELEDVVREAVTKVRNNPNY
jgi:hypothetical protein